jgi:hypothetical protein
MHRIAVEVKTLSRILSQSRSKYWENIGTLASGLRNPWDRAGVLEWIAMTTYLLVVILKKPLGLDASLHHIRQVLSISQIERTPILRAFRRDPTEVGILAASN